MGKITTLILMIACAVTIGSTAMGKGRILTDHGEGRYTIEILEDRTRAETRKATAEQRITQIDSKISELEQQFSDWQSEVDRAASVQDEEIDDYQQAIETAGSNPTDEQAKAIEKARQSMVDAAKNLQIIAAERDAIARNIAATKVERLTLQTRIDQINALPPMRQQEAWCADYTEDLAGEVATAEVPGEIGQVIIQPGFSDGAAWSAADDGAIQPALSGTPASVFYNLAMMPGWQKWRPTFRIATISNIDNDLCDISLDSATSSQQGLNVNAQGSYSGVPIMYMDCNGDAFEDGDRVLVAFSGNTNQPMVVGFEQEPKECAKGAIWIYMRVPWDEVYVIFDALREWVNENGPRRGVRVWYMVAGHAGGYNLTFWHTGVMRSLTLDYIDYAEQQSLDFQAGLQSDFGGDWVEVPYMLFYWYAVKQQANTWYSITTAPKDYLSSIGHPDRDVAVLHFGRERTNSTRQDDIDNIISELEYNHSFTAVTYDMFPDYDPDLFPYTVASRSFVDRTTGGSFGSVSQTKQILDDAIQEATSPAD